MPAESAVKYAPTLWRVCLKIVVDLCIRLSLHINDNRSTIGFRNAHKYCLD